jgi:hypothetical protein
MNTYELSREWFEFCFENPEKIDLNFIKRYKYKPSNDYSKGGFYLIKTSKGIYIGKSINYINRIKQHLYNSSNKIDIDKILNTNTYIESYLLLGYNAVGINYHTRKLETIIEQTFISIAINKNIKILNKRIYGHLQIV